MTWKTSGMHADLTVTISNRYLDLQLDNPLDNPLSLADTAAQVVSAGEPRCPLGLTWACA
jgi:hypothetical protein